MQTNYQETLKHILSNALVHIDGITSEIRKLDFKNDGTETDPEKIRRARMLDTMIIAINDIIHPAHKLLSEYFPGDEAFFNILIESQKKAKEAKMLFIGCSCEDCKTSIPDVQVVVPEKVR